MQYCDKQNSLSFQNITQTMKIKRSKKQGLCYCHPDKQAKYRDRLSDLLYCTSCAIQEASKGGLIEDFTRKSIQGCQISSFLTKVYEQCQAQIQQYICTYNTSYQRLIQTLTDIQIKDLLCFNKKIEENHINYQQMKRDFMGNLNKQELKSIFISQEHKVIITKINHLNKSMNNYKLDGSHSLEIKERLSPKVIIKDQSDYSKFKELNISSKSFHEKIICSRQSARPSSNISNDNTNSFKSKNNSTFQQIKKSVYEDTPESIKMRLSQNSFKVTSEMAVTMFEKIDVCESIDISHKSNDICEVNSIESGEGRSSFSSLKSRYRYKKENQMEQQ